MKMPLRRRYALAFLTLAVAIIAVFTFIMTAQVARQQDMTTRASLRVMSTTLDVIANDRARLVAELTAGALADAIAQRREPGGANALAEHAANLRSRDNFAFLRVYDAAGDAIYAEGVTTPEALALGFGFARLSLASGDAHSWERDGVMHASAAAEGPSGMIGAVHLGLPLTPLSASLAPVEAELAKTAARENDEHFAYVLVAAAAVLLVSLTLAMWSARDLSQPIEQLSRLTARYGRGDYDAEVPVQREDEIGALADALRRMARNLKETTVSRDELERAVEEALRANRGKSEFIAVMSHELRTPLNAVIGFAQMMKSEVLGPIGNRRYREYAGDIHDSAMQLLEMVNEILDSAKFEAGQQELREERVDLPVLIDATLRLFAERAARHGLRLQADLAASLPPLMADRQMMRQILNNLLSNAVKFTPENGTVTVRAGLTSESLWLSVEDTGIGMAPEDIPKALTPYVQIDSAQNREHRGTGLGLPLVKALAELHGGSLVIDSAPGSGTAITLFFPQSRIVAPDDDGQSSLPLWQGAAG
ncbi:MAG: ATP-binding protein [Alphaproteobacteria bacterium]